MRGKKMKWGDGERIASGVVLKEQSCGKKSCGKIQSFKNEDKDFYTDEEKSQEASRGSLTTDNIIGG